jgi:hypothetical protein
MIDDINSAPLMDAIRNKAGIAPKSIVSKPGIYTLSEDVYHGDSFPAPCISSGVLKSILLKSPLHAWMGHPALNPKHVEYTSDSFDIGTAAHLLLLEGVDKIAVIDAKDYRTNDAKAARDNARLDGKIPLLPHQYEDVKGMVEAAQKCLAESELGICDLRAEGVSESSWIWQEESTWLKIRPDWISSDTTLVVDYKTTGNSANPEGIAKIILNFGYHIQDALYRRGVNALTGITPNFVFLFQETTEPYMCSLISLPDQFQDMANWQVEKGIARFRECLASGNWPGYPTQVCYPDLPSWAFAQWQGEICIEEGL